MNWLSREFPQLTDANARVTSPRNVEYNCIAWAMNDDARWWEPGIFWPSNSEPGELGIAVLEALFHDQGFVDCDSPDSEPGFEKVALYGNNLFYTHAARQLSNGRWTSKLGKWEDIEHDSPDDVAGGVLWRSPAAHETPAGNEVVVRAARLSYGETRSRLR